MNLLFEKAEKARLTSQFKTAQRIYQSLLHKSLSPESKAEALLGLADVERIQGYFTESLKHYQLASKLLKKIDPAARVDAQVGWALAARAVGRPLEALKELKKSLISYKKDKDPQGEAFVHWALGGTLRFAGDMKTGLKELQTALRMFRALKNEEGVSYTYCALGGIFRMLGRYAESGKFYRAANHEMRHRKDSFGIAYSYCGLGNVERMAGRFKQALPFYKKAEKLYGTIGDRVSYAYTLWSIGTTYKMMGMYPQARLAFQKADKLFKLTGDTRGRIYTLLGFAEIEYSKDDFRKFLYAYWRPAEKLSEKYGFAWENLHVKTLLHMSVFQVFKKVEQAYSPKELKKTKRGLTKAMRFTETSYLKAGSKFQPKSIPVNWP